jgi:hypothetical protein
MTPDSHSLSDRAERDLLRPGQFVRVVDANEYIGILRHMYNEAIIKWPL